MQRWLNEWIMNYVDADPVNSSQETKARRPLAAAEVVVEEVEGNPCYYDAKFFLRPHFQRRADRIAAHGDKTAVSEAGQCLMHLFCECINNIRGY